MQDSPHRLDKRRGGVLLHPTSLPGSPGNGDFGPNAYWFVDFLQRSGISVWQTLPLGPTHTDGSPYQSLSAHAGNPLLISLELLVQAGWLYQDEEWPGEESVLSYRKKRLREALLSFQHHASETERQDYQVFLQKNAHWLDDYALFRALKPECENRAWWEWPVGYRDRDPQALAEAGERLAAEVEQQRFEQFIFFRQWLALKAYANARGIKVIGDLPIFVAADSVDVWANRSNFQLDDTGRPTVVAGVPPDYFSATGQYWGNPHYDWTYLESTGFQWWLDRLSAQESLFDIVRIDHFRGFEAYWEIPAHAPNAMHGRWVKAPGQALFERIGKAGTIPLIAEDLGVITPEVEALRDGFGIPGMKILQFAFDGGPENVYLPHHHVENCVIYTGTHDNDTTLGWFQALPEGAQAYLCEYLGCRPEDMPWALIRAAFASVARMAIVPMQDLLELDSAHRMNRPGVAGGNWHWRFHWEQVPSDLHERLRRMLEIYGRL
jgi:4-alpha-glucanotransferase